MMNSANGKTEKSNKEDFKKQVKVYMNTLKEKVQGMERQMSECEKEKNYYKLKYFEVEAQVQFLQLKNIEYNE